MARRPSAHVAVSSRRVPKAPGPTAQAVLVDQPGQTLYLAGILPLEPPVGKPCQGPMRRQMEVVMSHLKGLLAEARFSLDEVVRVTLYVTELKHLDIVNEVYSKQFVSQALPARTLVQVASVGMENLLVALDATAVKQAPAAPPAAPPAETSQYDDEEPMY